MTYDKFDEIWENIVIKKEIEYQEKYSLRDDFFIIPFAKRRVYHIYQRKKSFIKNNYMRNPSKNLDRHKVAACLLYSIVMVRPYRIKPRTILRKMLHFERIPKEMLLINEYVSFMTAISVVESFIKYSEEKYNTKKKHCSIPPTGNGESYIYNTCLDMHYSREKNNINILTFANVLFLLETGCFDKNNIDGTSELMSES